MPSKFAVAWDNGNHACGVLSERFDTRDEATAFGESWLAQWGSKPPDADDWYSYEVVEVDH